MMSKILVFDIETTGLKFEEGARMIECAYVIYEDEVLVKEVEAVLNPYSLEEMINIDELGLELNPANHVNNISEDAVRNGIVSEVFLHEIYEDFTSVDYLMGHNVVNFDIPFISKEFKHYGLSFNEFTYKSRNKCIDTLIKARTIKKYSDKLNLYSMSLASLCNHFGIVNEDAHRALSDVKATYQVYLALIKL